MEYEKIKQLINDMGSSKLTELDIDFPDGTKISMKKEIGGEKFTESNTEVKIEEKKIEREEKQENKGNVIKSPMVGTFYLKPSPTSEPFVEKGREISKGETICIIEAMKLMNEIESEFSGIVKEILLKDGDPVEYGTELFIIE